MSKRLLLLPLLLSVTCPTAWAQDPVGGEFRVNSYTTGNQWGHAVASDASGNFVVVWVSPYQDGGSTRVFGQRFNAAGVPRGSEFQVNSYTAAGRPAVASDASGNFVVVWESPGQDGSYLDVFGRRFDVAGLPQGSEFRVNSYTTASQNSPAVASDASGDFVVVWNGLWQLGSYGTLWDVFGQRFNAAGFPEGGEFRVNSYITGYQTFPAVASDASGNFVVVWGSLGQDGSGDGIFGQRFDASGIPQGSEFRVNSFTPYGQSFPAVASDVNGNFVVVWESPGYWDWTDGVFGQRFNAAGAPQGSEFQVNTYTTDQQGWPAVASDATGNFVVVWESFGQDGSYYGVFGQRFNAAGVSQGSEFQVNSYTTRSQRDPAVASAANGNFVVVWQSQGWQSQGEDGSYSGIYGQRYGDLIFKDGFE